MLCLLLCNETVEADEVDASQEESFVWQPLTLPLNCVEALSNDGSPFISLLCSMTPPKVDCELFFENNMYEKKNILIFLKKNIYIKMLV